ncbi:MAG: dihydropteroate synthase [Myxococcaceae bacterium]
MRAGLESAALVTGLSDDEREVLAELADAGWVGGAGDAAIVRWSRASIEAWLGRLQPTSELAQALLRLSRAGQGLPASTLGGTRFAWGERTFVMGVLNVTPDSFSDGGKFADPAAAIAHGKAMLEAGADLIDLGGESTRPGAKEVDEQVERDRVLPVIKGLLSEVKGALISIDTRKAGVAEAAIAAGAVMVNDVGGLRDDKMIDVLAKTGASACVMHMQGTPDTMQQKPAYEDVGADILTGLELALRRAESRGVPRSRLWVDPGIGFGKTVGHNLFLLQRLGDFRLLGCPVLAGVSRKKFIGALTGRDVPKDRLVASVATAAMIAAQGGVDVLRVHDVAETREALKVADAMRLARDGGSRFGLP